MYYVYAEHPTQPDLWTVSTCKDRPEADRVIHSWELQGYNVNWFAW